MKRMLLILILLLFSITILSACSYWPRTLTPKYVSDSLKDTKDDIDDSFGTRGYNNR